MSLSAQQVSLSVSGVSLLRAVDISVEPGRITAILGPNGAGKTSLLRVLTGEALPQRGKVSLDGMDLRDWSSAARARSLAVLPQHSTLSFPFTAAEVVMMGRIPHASGVARDREIAARALQAVDGDYLAQRIFTHLSGGEKQRVHLARVLAQIWEPSNGAGRYLCLDEPTSSFDLAHQQLTLEIVRNLGQEGVGVLIVIHDLNLAARCADHMVLLRDGGTVIDGSPQQVLTPGTIRDVFQVEAQITEHPLSGKPLVIT